MAQITKVQPTVTNATSDKTYVNTLATTFANPVAVNNTTIVVIFDAADQQNGTGSVTNRVTSVIDDVGNTYTLDSYHIAASDVNVRIAVYRSANPTGGAKVVTANLGSNYDALSMISTEYSGLLTNSVDQNTFSADSGYTQAHNTGYYGTLAQANELVIGVYGSSNASANYSIGAGFNTPITAFNVGQYLSGTYSDKVVNTTASNNATFQSDAYTKGLGLILTYKGTDATAVSPTPPIPTKFMAATASNQAYLSWDAPMQQQTGGFYTNTGITGFTLKRATVSGGPYTTLSSTITTSYYNDTAVTTGSTYYYVLTATSNGGTSAQTPELTITITAPVSTKSDSWYANGYAPSGVTQSTIRGWVRNHWDKNVSYMFTQSGATLGGYGGYRVQVPDQNFYNNTNNGTVSEGIGYAMIASVYMSNPNSPMYDVKALSYFNGFLTYYKQYQDVRGLMHWDIRPDGTLADYNGATDGDLDIAFALLMMHRLRGSNGSVNYLAEGIALANAIDKYEFLPDADTYGAGTANLITNGDGWNMQVDTLVAPDYIRFCYFDIFGYHTGNTTRWSKIKAANLAFIKKYFTDVYTTGLVPDACGRDGKENNLYNWGGFQYFYNSIRMTFGYTLDYLWNGTTGMYNNQKKMADTVLLKNGNSQTQVNNLNAGRLPLDWSADGGYKNQCFVAGYGSVCTVQNSTTQLAGTIATWVHNNGVNENSYFGLWQGYLNLLLMSGEFVPNFGTVPPPPTPNPTTPGIATAAFLLNMV